jgi:glucose-1-phosphate thymidylyltransferase
MPPVKALILATHLPRDELTAIAGAAAAHVLCVANQPLVSFALDAAHGAGIEDVAIIVCKASRPHVRAALAGSAGKKPVWIETQEPLDVGESLVAAADFLGSSPFLVHSGDAILLQPLGPFLREVATGVADALLLSCDDRRGGPAIRRLSDSIERAPSGDTLAGAHLFGGRALEIAGAVEGDLSAFAAALSRAGGRVATRRVECSWTYEGTIDHVLEANRMVLDELRGSRIDTESFDQVRIEGRVSLHPSARLERTTVRGPAVIGPGAVLRDAFIGPYSAIGADVTIEGAEVEHSIVLAGARIRRPGQRLESSLVGEGATVARDFALGSSLRVRVGERTEVRLV